MHVCINQEAALSGLSGQSIGIIKTYLSYTKTRLVCVCKYITKKEKESHKNKGGFSVLSGIPETAHLWYTNKREVLEHSPVFYVLTILNQLIFVGTQH